MNTAEMAPRPAKRRKLNNIASFGPASHREQLERMSAHGDLELKLADGDRYMVGCPAWNPLPPDHRSSKFLIPRRLRSVPGP
jgi:hypothetical protein